MLPMGYRNLSACVHDLEKTRQLVRIDCEVDAEHEVGIIQRRVYQSGGPALLFTNVRGCSFPLLGNLFGTLERTRFLFRDTLERIHRMVAVKNDPASLLRAPLGILDAARGGLSFLPRKVRSGPVLAHETSIDRLPQIKSWPLDGGAFITLPIVYSESAARPGWRASNLGMYRVQLSGNRYEPNREIGLHYQIHRGIGVHHAEALARGIPFQVNIFVGGPPSLTVAAVMPLPEGMPELAFAGLLGGHRLPLVQTDREPAIVAEADFCITGTVDPHRTLPEGPFGDHLGYYSLAHDFPVMKVERVTHRPGAIWPFTTVGRPPQEDTSFGAFIHELTGDLIPSVLPGVRAVHAVDAAGVHPLLLALGSERYLPYEPQRQPREILTQANAILGQGQLSLAKYLFIAAWEDAPTLDIHHIDDVFRHILERADWRRDLHFQTRTTIDTLDYTGTGLNEGSKVVIAAAGPKRRELPRDIPGDLRLPDGFDRPRIALPGILVVEGPRAVAPRGENDPAMAAFCAYFGKDDPINAFPLVVVTDDSEFTARNIDNFVWVTFTRSDPAGDIYGVGESVLAKHWGCSGALVIDARRKPHHAPSLEVDPAAEKRIDALGAPGGPLHGII
jgi:4-hydroxy-3-polyprenylbenzoate decarboxylase